MAKETCAYCGAIATTRDHVVAECLLLDKSSCVTVPCCSRCNKEKAKEDEYLRDTFAIRIETSELEALQDKKDAAIRSAMRPDRWSPSKQLLLACQKHPKFAVTGDLLGFELVTVARSERMYAALSWIARGIYFHHTRRVLEKESSFLLWSYSGDENADVLNKVWETETGFDRYSIGQTLAYRFMHLDLKPPFANWEFVFYDSVFFILSANEHRLHEESYRRGLISREEFFEALDSLKTD